MGTKPAKTASRPGAPAEIVRGPKFARITRATDRAGGFVAWHNNRRVAAGPTIEACEECVTRNGYVLQENKAA